MAADDVDEYELEKLRAEIHQERQMKEMLDQSAKELRITVEELEKRYDSIENEAIDEELALTERDQGQTTARLKELDKECNEWKTRFETQEEMNQQLEKQIIMLQDKVEEAKRNLKDALYREKLERKRKTKAYVEGRASSPRSHPDRPKSKNTGITINISVSPQAGKTPRDMKTFDDLSDANPSMVKSMEKEKNLLYNQLRDLEWRLDQESKAYHKANDERKQYVVEINATKGNIDGNKARQRAAVGIQQREVDDMSRSPRLMGYTERFKLKSHYRAKVEKDRKSTSRLTVSSRMSPASRVSVNASSRTSPGRKSSVTSLRSSSISALSSSMGSRVASLSNIPEDQRIIDPRKGPIKKTAAVKNLPSLETT